MAMVQASEVRLMASVAARAPLHLVGGGLDPAFGALPMLLAHRAPTGASGAARARLWGHEVQLVLPRANPTCPRFDRRCDDLRAVRHLGGAARRPARRRGWPGCCLKPARTRCIWSDTAWAGSSSRRPSQVVASPGQVDTVVTLGSPFGGSPWAHLLPFAPITRALRGDSPLLRRLASAPLPDGVRWLAFTATLDMIVPGLRSVPPHSEVETVTVGGVGHLGMLLSQQVVGRIVAALAA